MYMTNRTFNTAWSDEAQPTLHSQALYNYHRWGVTRPSLHSPSVYVLINSGHGVVTLFLAKKYKALLSFSRS